MRTFHHFRTVVKQSAIVIILMSLMIGSTVQAQVGPVVPVAEVTKPAEKVALTLRESLMSSLMGSLISASSFFVRKVAHDTAVAFASAGNGQTPLIITNPLKWGEEVAAGTVGEAVGQFGKPFGLNLCRPPSINIQLFVQVGIRDIYGTGNPTPACNWQSFSDVANAWGADAFAHTYGPQLNKFTDLKFNDILSVRNSDFGVTMGAIATVDQLTASKKAAADLQQLIGNNIKDIVSPISGETVTPAETLRKNLELASVTKQVDYSNTEIAGIYSAQLPNLVPTAINVFLGTFASTLMERLLNQGLVPPNPSNFNLNYYAGGPVLSQADAAARAFDFLLTPVISEQDNYDIIGQFATCPPNPGLNNCVMDQQLANGLRQIRSSGKTMTIQEALDAHVLDASKPLITWRRTADNTDVRNCYRTGYCYSNIQKMRKARILPLGFEIAAQKLPPDQRPVTLGEIVSRFDDCDPVGLPTAAHPYCHLINPNWVLKAPSARCETVAIGPVLVDQNSALRHDDECMDVSTCVVQNPDGSCAGIYGFCTKEKNIWRLGGQSCRAEYNTCTTFQGPSGTASYLRRTLDASACNENTVGCQAYSLDAIDVDAARWHSSAEVALPANLALKRTGVDNQIIHFNDAIGSQTCAANDDGCNAFYGGLVDSKTANYLTDEHGNYLIDTATVLPIKKAPAYLGCYDTNPATPEIDWPVNGSDLARVSTSQACNAYAHVCVKDEVGCDSYARVDDPTAPKIPGIVGNNACPNSCVGYDAFREEATLFAPTTSVQYLIPDSIDSSNRCSLTDVGCSEFTNIDEAARGGEALEYYTDLQYCEKPNGTNEGVYYSWEGSVELGYRLQTHHLLRLSSSMSTNIGLMGLQYTNNDTAGTFFAPDSPAYARTMSTDLQSLYNSCNASVYAAALANQHATGVFNADCRALYDDSGHIYYRVLADVAEVSAACHPLRKTTTFLVPDAVATDVTNRGQGGSNGQNFCQALGGDWEDDPTDSVAAPVCRRCANGGQYNGGACIYYTTSQPGGAFSCPATANGCRKYTGTTGGNVHANVIFKTFEPAAATPNALTDAAAGWGPTTNPAVRVVSEALTVGQYSLLLPAGEDTFNYRLDSTQGETVTSSGWYELNFWARGDANNLKVQFLQSGHVVGDFTVNPATGASSPVAVGTSWQPHTLGQVQFTGNGTDPVDLMFIKANAGQAVYIDNVRLTWVQNEVLAVKGSWVTPTECDNTPNDNLPGAMLGCKAYTNSQGKQVNATGFDKLCREQAVGCMPVVDTQNTLAGEHPAWAHAYNVWCEGSAGPSTCSLHVSNGVDPAVDVSCPVLLGSTGCYVNTAIELPPNYTLPANAVKVSTIVIPADTATTSPIYLTNTTGVQCSATQIGCMRLGAERKVLPTANSPYTYTNTMVLNQPDAYVGVAGARGTLCSAEAVSCSRFTSDDGVAYFKDPTLNGQATCSYKDVQTANGPATGWFLDGVGVCTNNHANYCRADSDCGAGDTCDQGSVGKQACYPGYQHLQNGKIIYDLWSNDSVPNYAGLVGVCPSDQNSCIELLDPKDTSTDHPTGQPYYALYNSDLKAKSAACNGQVSLQNGCVLFQKTDDPHSQFDADATYALSARTTPPNGLVSPVSTATNDANLILKVDRDRTCDEWLSCKSSTQEKQADGSVKNLCYEYKSCTAAEVSTDPGGRCTDRPGVTPDTGARLTESNYIRRDTGWYGKEYSGYSLYSKYQVNDLKYVSFDVTDYLNQHPNSPDAQFLHDVSNHLYLVYDRTSADAECVGATSDWTACGAPDNGGRCYANQCLYRLDGSFPIDVSPNGDPVAVIRALTTGSCKAYPESDSPFPRSIADVPSEPAPQPIAAAYANGVSRYEFATKKSGFGAANVCQNGDCSCGYIRTTYKNGVSDFWPIIGNQRTPVGVCVAGDSAKQGGACSVDNDCGTGGSCSKLASKKTDIGVQGFCLEPDYSRPINGATLHAEDQEYACLTWFPIDVSASNIDINNHVQTAGYYPPLDANADPSATDGSGVTGQVYCAEASGLGGRLDESGDPQNNPITPAQVNTWLATYFTGANPYFNANGYPAGGSNGFASTINSDPLSNLRPNIPTIYAMMQSWAWQVLGTNATVLRTENGWEPAGGFSHDNVSGANCLTINTPAAFGAPFRLSDPCTTGATSNGTVMHPPRTWGDTNTTRVNGLITETARVGFNSTRAPIFSGVAFAPYPEFENSVTYQGQTIANSIRNPFIELTHRFTSEDVLHESDLKRVYFITESQTHGAAVNDTVYPKVLGHGDDDGLYIDFAALDTSERSAQFRSGVSGDYRDFIGGNNQSLTNGAVWTYRLDATSPRGLETLSSYPGQDNPTVNVNIAHYTGTTDTDSPRDSHGNSRNAIARRYVMVYGATPNNSSPVPFFGNMDARNVAPPLPGQDETDPFATVTHCSATDNWFAVGMDFNADGEFLGYITRRCRALGVSPMTVVATLADKCTTLAQVYDDTHLGGSEPTNKAWTNRVWQYARNVTTLAEALHPFFSTVNAQPFLRSVLNIPFGSTWLLGANMAAGDYSASNYTFRFTTAQNAIPADGVPYSCSAPTWRGIPTVVSAECAPSDSQAGVVSGNTNGLAALDQLFVRTFALGTVTGAGTFTVNTNPGHDVAGDTTVGQVSTIDSQTLIPPQIYSLNIADCFGGTARGGNCTAGEPNNMTVSGHNGTLNNYDHDRANAADEDRDGDGIPDPYIKVGTETANLQFFAFADDNRMPIRRVMIDWGDGSTIVNENRYGLYRNRKPFCSTEDSSDLTVGLCGTAPDELTGITCHGQDTDCPVNTVDTNGNQIQYHCYGDTGANGSRDNVTFNQYQSSPEYQSARFGNAPRACSAEPFQFLHDYNCSFDPASTNLPSYVVAVSSITNADTRAQLIGTYHLHNDSKVCVFQPRVQVMDNWGWCNGSCVGQANGCYNGATEIINGVRFNGVQQCGADSNLGNDDPWTYYQGRIIVVPQSRN